MYLCCPTREKNGINLERTVLIVRRMVISISKYTCTYKNITPSNKAVLVLLS